MKNQRSSRDSRRDSRHYNTETATNSIISILDNDSGDLKNYAELLNMETDDYDPHVVHSDARSRRRRSTASEKLQYERKGSGTSARSKSSASGKKNEKQKRRKRSRKDTNDSSEYVEEYDNEEMERHSRKSRKGTSSKNSNESDFSRRKRKKKRYASASEELPITDILRKTPENLTKYEDPIALPELMTNTIYVQSGSSFNAVKLTKENAETRKAFEEAKECDSRPIKVAIVTQKGWKWIGFIHQGLLAGMALMHFILLQTFFQDSVQFVANYCILSEIYTTIFSFLITMCIISIFDKFDIALIDFAHLKEIYTNYAKSAIAVFLYLASFCLHQITYKTNDKFALIHYKSVNSSVAELLKNDSSLNTIFNEMAMWQKMTIAKDILAVLAWFFISLGAQDNILLMNLKNMIKFGEG